MKNKYILIPKERDNTEHFEKTIIIKGTKSKFKSNHNTGSLIYLTFSTEI